ncbi:MAG: leucine-rich repeat domain-containing protein [Trueperaceae bacterium]|nr:leucine-rich repeat domain-containing protein [Trueperaceae bacterium]
MKRIVLFGLFLMGFLVACQPAIPVDPIFTGCEGPINVPDEHLKVEIRNQVNATGEELTCIDMQRLIEIDFSNREITDLTGLRYATNLKQIRLFYNKIKSLEELKGLTKLESIDVSSNQISDISPLSGLFSLKQLQLAENEIKDLKPLESLPQLTGLYISQNQVSDISSLAGLTQLSRLYLAYNQIRDISSLSGLTKLAELNLFFNRLTDIKPLINNQGIGEGDFVDINFNCFPTWDNTNAVLKADIQKLLDRGVLLNYDQQEATCD